MKTLMAVGILLIVIGLSGRALSTGSIATETKDPSSELATTIENHRERTDTYKLIGIAGAIIVIGSQVGLRFQSKH